MLVQIHLKAVLLSIFLTAISLNVAAQSFARNPASMHRCSSAHSLAANTTLGIFPTFVRISPFDGTIKFQAPDGSIIRHNMMKRPTLFLNNVDERNPVQRTFGINHLTANELLPNVYVSPRDVPAGSKRLPLDVEQLYEEAVGDIYTWSPESKEASKMSYLEMDKGRQHLAKLSSQVVIPDFLKPILPRVEVLGETVFVQIKVNYARDQVHSFHADLGRNFLDMYFTALQKAYREQGDPSLGKAIKLLDSWVHAHLEQKTVRVHLVYDKALWNLMMAQLTEAIQMPGLMETDSYQRTRVLHSFTRQFLPLAGMMATSQGSGTFEIGRLFNNPETDPLKIYFPDGKSQIQGSKLQSTTQNLYRFVLQDLPANTDVWTRLFTRAHAALFRKYGFQEPTQPSSLYLQSKQEIENYWKISQSWLLEQKRESWLETLTNQK